MDTKVLPRAVSHVIFYRQVFSWSVQFFITHIFPGNAKNHIPRALKCRVLNYASQTTCQFLFAIEDRGSIISPTVIRSCILGNVLEGE